MKRITILLASITIVAMIIVGIALSRRSNPTIARDQRGVSLSPIDFTEKNYLEFYDQAAQTGGLVSWTGHWTEFNSRESAPFRVVKTMKEKDLTPVLLLQFFTANPKPSLVSVSDDERSKIISNLTELILEENLKYVGLGVEVNRLADEDQDAYALYLDLFDEIRDAIKARSSETKVFPIFQYENMKGLNGGLFGGEDDETQNDFDLLEYFDDADMIAFTTYPAIVFKDPSDIPFDYYKSIREFTDRPVAFTEIGWFSEFPWDTQWQSSEAEQARFLERFLSDMDVLKPEILIYSFLYDQQTAPDPFRHMGLISKDGKIKAGLEVWR